MSASRAKRHARGTGSPSRTSSALSLAGQLSGNAGPELGPITGAEIALLDRRAARRAAGGARDPGKLPIAGRLFSADRSPAEPSVSGSLGLSV